MGGLITRTRTHPLIVSTFRFHFIYVCFLQYVVLIYDFFCALVVYLHWSTTPMAVWRLGVCMGVCWAAGDLSCGHLMQWRSYLRNDWGLSKCHAGEFKVMFFPLSLSFWLTKHRWQNESGARMATNIRRSDDECFLLSVALLILTQFHELGKHQSLDYGLVLYRCQTVPDAKSSLSLCGLVRKSGISPSIQNCGQ